MSSMQGDSPEGWSRHWEVLDRVGLPDYTPDVQWQADVLQRAGVQPPRPLSSVQNRRTAPVAAPSKIDGSGGGTSAADSVGANRRSPQVGGLGSAGPPTATGPGTGPGPSHGSSQRGERGGGVCLLHPRLRTGLSKQPANRTRQPPLPLEAALNLQLVEGAELHTMHITQQPAVHMQAQAQERPPPHPPTLEQQQQQQYGTQYGALAHPGVPRLELAAAGLSGEHSGGLGGAGGSCQSSGTLPSLAPTPTGAGAQAHAIAAAAAAAAQPDVTGGGGDAAWGRGGSVVSFRIPLPVMPPTRTVRTAPPAAAVAAAAVAAYSSAPLRRGSDRPAGGGGGVTWSEPAGQGLEPEGSEWATQEEEQGQQQQQQQQQQQIPWRPAAGAAGSGDLSARLAPSRKSSAGMSYMSYTSYAPHQPQHQQQQWLPQGRSLSGEPSTAPRYGTYVQSATASPAAAAVGSTTPRQRYKGIMERVGRAAAHKQPERGRPGAMAAAAGSAQLRRRNPVASASDDGSDDDGGSSGAASPRALDGLGRWGARWIQPLADLNEELNEGSSHTAASAAAAAAAVEPSRVAAGAGDQPPAAEDSQGPSQGLARSQWDLGGEAAARRLGVTERAVWQLRRALDELSRFSCAHVARRGDEAEEGSVLAQVDARINALRRYDRVEMRPDGRRASVIPPAPPAFPLDAAQEYLGCAQSGVAGLEQLEEAVGSMRRKLQILVGQDTDDLRRAAAEALADVRPTAAVGVTEPSSASETISGQSPYPIRRPSSSGVDLTLGAGPSYSGPPSSYRLHSANTTVSGQDPTAAAAPPPPGSIGYRSPPSSPYLSYSGAASPPPPATSRPWTANNRKSSAGSVTDRLGSHRPSGLGLESAWTLFESLVIQLHDSHASRVEVMEALDARATISGSGEAGSGGAPSLARGGAAAALLAAAAGGVVHQRGRRGRGRGRGGGGLDRLARLVNVIDENGGGGAGMAEAKEAAAEVAVNANAVRAAVAATLEPKHTEQALYFLAKLALMLQQDPRLPPDAGFLLAAGVDLLLGEVTWLLTLLRASSGAASPHLAALAATLRAYDMQRSYTVTLRAVAERLESAAEEAMDRSTLLERQVSSLHSALQRAGHEVAEMESNMREMERDMNKLKARNESLEETVAELEGDVDRVEAAHVGREATLRQAERLAGALLEEQLGRIKGRSRATQVASEGECSDPRAIPPSLQPAAHQYYPITPCVSSRNLQGSLTGSKGGGAAAAAAARALSRSGTKKHLRKSHNSRKGVSRAVSRRGARGSGGDGSAASAAAVAAAAEALAAARAAADASEDEDGDAAAEAQYGDEEADGRRPTDGGGSRLAALKRGVGIRTVSWVDRSPRRAGSPDGRLSGGQIDGRISPVTTAAAAAVAAVVSTAEGDPQRWADGTVRGPGVKSGARTSGGELEGGRREGTGRSSSPTAGRSKSSRARSHSKTPKAGHVPSSSTTTPDPHQQQQAQQDPHQELLQLQQQQRLQELQLQQQQQQWGQRGVDGIEYWAPAVGQEEGGGGGGGTGSGSAGDGGEQGVVVRDEALEQAARDMFSDVFVRQLSGGPPGRPRA